MIEELTEKGVTDITEGKLKEIACQVCSVNEKEFNEMLNSYHNLGVIIHHKDLVVLKRQFLAEQFTKLIVIPKANEQVLFVKDSGRSC